MREGDTEGGKERLMAVLGVFRGKDAAAAKRAEDELKAKVSGKAAENEEEREEQANPRIFSFQVTASPCTHGHSTRATRV